MRPAVTFEYAIFVLSGLRYLTARKVRLKKVQGGLPNIFLS